MINVIHEPTGVFKLVADRYYASEKNQDAEQLHA